MFEYLKAEAYTRLREEITSAIIADLGNKGTEVTGFYAGRMCAYSKILTIVNRVHRDLLEALDIEAEKEAAYYEAGQAAEESASKQL